MTRFQAGVDGQKISARNLRLTGAKVFARAVDFG
jgi:hypothetical protein